jgi:hypothetical protein
MEPLHRCGGVDVTVVPRSVTVAEVGQHRGRYTIRQRRGQQTPQHGVADVDTEARLSTKVRPRQCEQR